MEMTRTVFESTRHFALGSHAASYGLLLFRSNRTTELASRLDLLFQDVRAMDVRAWTDGLKVEICDESAVRDYPSNPQDMIESGLVLYRISGAGWQGFIVASTRVSSKEDQLGPMDPSGLIPR